MKNKKIAKLSVALGLSCIALIGGINAYFTDGDTATNTFTVGKVSLKLEEPSWTPPTDITPNQEIDKDPQITNDGVNDEFVFLEVKVPYANIVTAEENGTRKEAADTELFSYTTNAGWTEIGTPVKADGVVTHLYAYGSATECTALAKDGKTPALFDSVKFCNAIEDQGLEGTTKEIVINAYGIQTQNVNGGKKAPADVWSVVNTQGPAIDDK